MDEAGSAVLRCLVDGDRRTEGRRRRRLACSVEVGQLLEYDGRGRGGLGRVGVVVAIVRQEVARHRSTFIGGGGVIDRGGRGIDRSDGNVIVSTAIGVGANTRVSQVIDVDGQRVGPVDAGITQEGDLTEGIVDLRDRTLQDDAGRAIGGDGCRGRTDRQRAAEDTHGDLDATSAVGFEVIDVRNT